MCSGTHGSVKIKKPRSHGKVMGRRFFGLNIDAAAIALQNLGCSIGT